VERDSSSFFQAGPFPRNNNASGAYRSAKLPVDVKLPDVDKLVGPDMDQARRNVMGEFGWKEVLKQFLGEDRAKTLAAAWMAIAMWFSNKSEPSACCWSAG